jgi:CDGSH-type Zn-finger protein
MKDRKIVVSKNGPYIVSNLPLKEEEVVFDKNNFPLKYKTNKKFTQKNYSLCRCGKSKNKPFCDSSHLLGFEGKETAKNDSGKLIKGNGLVLRDIESLCAGAGFCDRAAGVWQLINMKDKKSKDIAITESCNCPSGRLTIIKNNKEIEPKFSQSISVLEETGMGPIWVKGNVPIFSSSGKQYPSRNRITLCRCGKSKNKPFCDGSHFS